jgi:carboxyl-terminal processing protease
MLHATLTTTDGQSQNGASLRDIPIGKKGGSHIAVITLPTFYLDTDAKLRGATDYNSSTKDVQRLIAQAQQSGAAGLVLDLRGNGGGSLSEATEIASLFVGQRPLWRKRDAKGDIEEVRGATKTALWNGPLAVLIDHGSAEGSELVASALQSNQRALVLGARSMGAGNVASVVDLARFERDSFSSEHNLLVLTIATTFRANGEGITGHAVVPDIDVPVAPASELTTGPALVAFAQLPPTPSAPMLDLQKALPALRRAYAERAGQSSIAGLRTDDAADDLAGHAWPLDLTQRKALREKATTDQPSRPDEEALMRDVASILADEKRELFR